MKLTIFSSDGTTSREEDFAGLPVFEGDKGRQALKEVIVAIRANRRQGTHSTKTRGEVRGGGVVFGPKPRDYSKKINARVKSLAFRRALFERASAGEIAVIDGFFANAVKTKAVNTIVGRIAPKGRILLVDAPFAADTARATRNLGRVFMQDATQLNPWDLAQYRKIIVSSKALETILSRAKGENHG